MIKARVYGLHMNTVLQESRLIYRLDRSVIIQGSQGNLLCSISYLDQVYVGTSLGLFKLEQEEIYDEITYFVYVEVKQKQKDPNPQKPVIEKEPEKETQAIQTEVESKKRGLLRFLKRNRNKQPSQTEPADSKEEVEDDISSADNMAPASDDEEIIPELTYERIAKTEKVFRSAQYVYKKVAGIEAKVTQLLEANGQLISAGLGGAHQVQGLQASPILEEPASSVFSDNAQKLLFISTYKNEIKTYVRTQDGWTKSSLLDNLEDQITEVFRGEGNEFWFCAMDKVYRLDISNQKLNNLQTIAFSNPNFDEVVGIQWRDKIMLANSQGFFQFDKNKNLFVRIDSLGEPSHYFSGDGNIWFRDAHSWSLFGQRPGQSNLHLLNLHRDLRFVASDQNSENLWLITGSNELYKFFGEKYTPYEAGYPILLKSIRNDNRKVSTTRNIAI